MNNSEVVTIESVDIVSGESIKPAYVEATWKSKMQKIHVKEEPAYFIENMKGKSFSKKSTAWRGIDMKPYVGKKVLIEKYDVNFHPREDGLWMKFIKVV